MFEYGSRVGFWRVQRIFEERGLPLTVFGCALALERNPAVAARHPRVGLRRVLARLALGQALRAQRGRGARAHPDGGRVDAEDGRRAAARLVLPLRPEREHAPAAGRGGRLPLRLRRLQRRAAVLGARERDSRTWWCRTASTANDSKFGSGGFFTADDYFTFVKDGFDVLYREGKTQPKMMSLGLHLRLIGHPSRAAGLERALDYIGSTRTCGSPGASTSRSTGSRPTPPPRAERPPSPCPLPPREGEGDHHHPLSSQGRSSTLSPARGRGQGEGAA